MSFEFDQTTLFYVLAAVSVVLFVEAIWVLGFSTASYRQQINRRLRLMKNQPDRESILIQLRRERGLTAGGLYATPVLSLNRLVLQSGLTLGLGRIAVAAVVAGLAAGAGVYLWREHVAETAAAVVAGGVVLPFAVLLFLRKRRHGRFAAQFPDAIDIIVRSLRAGHPIPVAISMVAREMADPIGTEFGVAADEITYGADLETGMRNLYFRVGQEDLPLFVTAVAIQTTTGGNLSEILENLSSVIRQRFKMRRKIKALAAEGRFSAIFLSGLPIAIFFILRAVAPNFYGDVLHLEMTQWGLAGAMTWMMIGNFLMYRMVNFKI